MRQVIAPAAALLVLAGAGGWMALDRPESASGASGAADREREAALYAEACASCHGAALEGQPDWKSPGPDGRLPAPPHDETGHTSHHSDRVLLDITMRGTAAVVGGGYESNMPGFGDEHSEAELRNVLEWIKSQWPARERTFQAQSTAADN